MDLNGLLQLTFERKASDLHLVAGVRPTLRVEGELLPVPEEPVLVPEAIDKMLQGILRPEQREQFIVNKELDFSLSFSEKARFRVNAYYQKNTSAVAFRFLPLKIPPIDALGLPGIVHNFTKLRQGLILVTGPTGHGKSTALASILDEINMTRAEHIVKIEDPVEFIFQPQKSIISQREMKVDTHSWEIALRSVLREDPNVVLVGEMRDAETIAAALTVAETGHLVFATLHTNSAAQTIDRIVDVFPEEQQGQTKLQLSQVLEAVFSMRLVLGTDGKRVAAGEILIGTPAVRTVIREGKTHQIDGIIQTSSAAGMLTLESSLALLIKSGRVTLEEALSWAIRPEELNRLVGRG